jgi:hypothetical protein
MNEPKPFASLGPTLLARKGGAKPAMRPQIAPMGPGGAQAAARALEEDFDALEDLGWNDMGDEDSAPERSADVLQLTPAPANPESEAKTDAGSPKALVRSIHEELAEMLEKGATELPASKAKATPVPAPKAVPSAKAVPAPKPTKPALVEVAATEETPEEAHRRAAFTLRLDAKRHLKLRLASTVKNRSAQQLVTQALDKFLAEIPEVEALAAQVKRNSQ